MIGGPLNTVIEFNRKTKFSLEKAQGLLPIIYRITEEAAKEVKLSINRIDAFSDKSHTQIPAIEESMNAVISKWQSKIEKLGGEPKGLWMVDFDNGQGFYCWKFPETKISYWHGYHDGFSGRCLISDLVDNTTKAQSDKVPPCELQ